MRVKGHKVEDLMSVGTSGAYVIGCECGWVHRQEVRADTRKAARAAHLAHKIAVTEGK
jgi:hypothetical protein